MPSNRAALIVFALAVLVGEIVVAVLIGFPLLQLGWLGGTGVPAEGAARTVLRVLPIVVGFVPGATASLLGSLLLARLARPHRSPGWVMGWSGGGLIAALVVPASLLGVEWGLAVAFAAAIGSAIGVSLSGRAADGALATALAAVANLLLLPPALVAFRAGFVFFGDGYAPLVLALPSVPVGFAAGLWLRKASSAGPIGTLCFAGIAPGLLSASYLLLLSVTGRGGMQAGSAGIAIAMAAGCLIGAAGAALPARSGSARTAAALGALLCFLLTSILVVRLSQETEWSSSRRSTAAGRGAAPALPSPSASPTPEPFVLVANPLDTGSERFSEAALSVFEAHADGCAWVHLDPLRDRRLEVTRFPMPCGDFSGAHASAPAVAWRPDGGAAILTLPAFTPMRAPDRRPTSARWHVTFDGGAAVPIAGPERELLYSGNDLVSRDRPGKAFRWTGTAWEHHYGGIEIDPTNDAGREDVPSYASPGVPEPVGRAVKRRDLLAMLEASGSPDATCDWREIVAAGSALYLCRLIAWKGRPFELGGYGHARVLDGGRAIAPPGFQETCTEGMCIPLHPSVRGSFVLLRDRFGGNAWLYDVRGRRVLYSNARSRRAELWPAASGRRRDPVPLPTAVVPEVVENVPRAFPLAGLERTAAALSGFEQGPEGCRWRVSDPVTNRSQVVAVFPGRCGVFVGVHPTGENRAPRVAWRSGGGGALVATPCGTGSVDPDEGCWRAWQVQFAKRTVEELPDPPGADTAAFRLAFDRSGRPIALAAATGAASRWNGSAWEAAAGVTRAGEGWKGLPPQRTNDIPPPSRSSAPGARDLARLRAVHPQARDAGEDHAFEWIRLGPGIWGYRVRRWKARPADALVAVVRLGNAEPAVVTEKWCDERYRTCAGFDATVKGRYLLQDMSRIGARVFDVTRGERIYNGGLRGACFWPDV